MENLLQEDYESEKDEEFDYSGFVENELSYDDSLDEREEKGDILLGKILEKRRTRGIEINETLEDNYSARGDL